MLPSSCSRVLMMLDDQGIGARMHYHYIILNTCCTLYWIEFDWIGLDWTTYACQL